ncbi:unnamed protein product, partial [Urochloa humidicola]
RVLPPPSDLSSNLLPRHLDTGKCFFSLAEGSLGDWDEQKESQAIGMLRFEQIGRAVRQAAATTVMCFPSVLGSVVGWTRT